MYRGQTALGRQGYVLLRFLGASLATCWPWSALTKYS